MVRRDCCGIGTGEQEVRLITLANSFDLADGRTTEVAEPASGRLKHLQLLWQGNDNNARQPGSYLP